MSALGQKQTSMIRRHSLDCEILPNIAKGSPTNATVRHAVTGNDI